jgi:hypothetical protein
MKLKLSETQKERLANILEVVLFIGGMTFGLAILGFGAYMLWTVIKALLS